MDKRVLHSPSALALVLLLSGAALSCCIHSHSNQNLLKIFLKKYLNSFIYCKMVKLVKNTCKEAILFSKIAGL